MFYFPAPSKTPVNPVDGTDASMFVQVGSQVLKTNSISSSPHSIPVQPTIVAVPTATQEFKSLPIPPSDNGAISLQQKKLAELDTKRSNTIPSEANDDFVDHPVDSKKMALLTGLSDNSLHQKPGFVSEAKSSTLCVDQSSNTVMSSPIHQVSDAEMSEPFKLQQMYDLHNSGDLPQDIHSHLQNLSVSNSVFKHQHSTGSNISNPEDYFPPADPDKLAKLLACDNPVLSETVNDNFVDHPIDERKNAYLQNLSENPDFTSSSTESFSTAESSGNVQSFVANENNSLTNDNNCFSLQTENNDVSPGLTEMNRKESDTDNTSVGLNDNYCPPPGVSTKLFNKKNRFINSFKEGKQNLYQENHEDAT